MLEFTTSTKLPVELAHFQNIDWIDPNVLNLVDMVSIKTPVNYAPPNNIVALNLKVLAIDVGMKCNQIRCFVKRGVHVKVVPWNYDFSNESDYDGLFIVKINTSWSYVIE